MPLIFSAISASGGNTDGEPFVLVRSERGIIRFHANPYPFSSLAMLIAYPVCAARHPVFIFSLLITLALQWPVRAQSNSAEMPVREKVTYANGDVVLAGSLMIPRGDGPFPGVVIIHGSGSSDRENPWTAAYADALVERGIAVLHPDKRGSGASGGDWRGASFEDLAGDAIAGLAVLRAHPLVDTVRVGLIGFSQGGHVVPLAATRSSAVRVVINVSGSVVPMMEQIGDEIRLMGMRDGLDTADLDTLQAIHKRAIHFALTGEGWDAYAAAIEAAKRGDLGGSSVLEGFPTTPDAPAWRIIGAFGSFDPMPYWREVDIPALFLYGGRDANVDVFKSTNLIEEDLTRSGLSYTLLLFRENGHALYREDAMDFVARWIRDGGAH